MSSSGGPDPRRSQAIRTPEASAANVVTLSPSIPALQVGDADGRASKLARPEGGTASGASLSRLLDPAHRRGRRRHRLLQPVEPGAARRHTHARDPARQEEDQQDEGGPEQEERLRERRPQDAWEI